MNKNILTIDGKLNRYIELFNKASRGVQLTEEEEKERKCLALIAGPILVKAMASPKRCGGLHYKY